MSLARFFRDYGIGFALLVLLVVLALTTENFLTTKNLLNIVRQNAPIAIIAAGMTLVILTGGIDLSVGSVVAVAGVITADILLKGGGLPLAVIAGVLVGGLGGAANGLLVTKLKVPPFLASLALMQIGRGVALKYTDARTIAVPSEHGLTSLATNAALTAAILVVFVLAWIVLTRTAFGRQVYAVGGNPEAARLAGVRVQGVLFNVYLLCGLLAGLGGVITAARLNSGYPSAGQLYELDAIAAVVVGGTSLFGGRGSVWGTLAGAFFIGALNNGLTLNDVDAYDQQIVKGVVLVGAMSLDLLRRRGDSS